MINGVILQKLQTLDTTLAELRSLGAVTAARLEADWRTQRAVERDLQVLVEIVIDICQRLVSLAGQTPAATSRDAVERAVALGALSAMDPYLKMVQLRNFIVHRCNRIDSAVLADMINDHLADFDQFRDEILAYTAQDSNRD